MLRSHAAEAYWRLGDGGLLLIAVNLHDARVPYCPDTKPGNEHLLFEAPGALHGLRVGVLPSDGLLALLMPSAPAQA